MYVQKTCCSAAMFPNALNKYTTHWLGIFINGVKGQ